MQQRKVGENRGIGVSFLIHYDTWSSRDGCCFSDSGVDNLEKGSFQNFSHYPFAFGHTLCCCYILLTGNRLERTALGISFLID